MPPRFALALSTSLPLVCASVAAWASVARAQEQETPQAAGSRPAATEAPSSAALSATLLGVFGAGGQFEDSDVNRYGWGAGARAGISLERPGIYLGGSFVRFLGGKDGSGEYYTVTLNAEAGYDFMLAGGSLFLRPMLALGIAQLASIQSDNAGYPLALHGAPALLFGARLTPVLLTLEARNDVVAGSWSNALTFALGAGVEL